jgi:xanthine dehydrogenase iron-sulfur cluster and FAD-binding subunit A
MHFPRLTPTLILSLLVLLVACRNQDPRIGAAETVAETACACTGLACAVAAAAPLLEVRGLEQEDYANLPADQIARFEAAVDRTEACMRALILE